MRNRVSALPVTVLMAMFAIGSVVQSPNPAKAAQAPAVSAEDFYKKNIVNLIVTSKPGGGTDLAARLFSAYWNQYTGGYLKLVNEPGGGGLVGGNQTYSAKPDGLTLGAGEYGGDIVGPAVAKPKGLQYDAGKVNWLGLFGGDPYVFALSPKVPYNTIDDLKQAKSLVMAGMTPGGSTNIASCIVADIIGIKGAVNLFGHEGSAESGMAMASGELEAYVMSSSTVRDHLGKGWIKKPLAIVDTERSKSYPGVPAITEVGQLNPNQKRLLNYFLTVLRVGKAFYTSPGVPADRVAFLRDVFDKITADKAFVSQASLRWIAWEKPIPGKELQQITAQAMQITPEDIKLVEQTLAKYNKK